MNILFIADPLATFKTYKDTTYAMMREASKRGHKLHHTLAGELSVQNGKVVATPRLSNLSARKTTTTTNGSNRRTKCRLL